MMLISISKPLRAPVDRLYPRRGEPISQLVNEALSRFLRVSLHTSGALVQGVYERAVSSTLLLFYSTTATLGLEPSRTLMARWPYSTEQSTKCGAIATDNPPQRGGSGNSLRRHFAEKATRRIDIGQFSSVVYEWDCHACLNIAETWILEGGNRR